MILEAIFSLIQFLGKLLFEWWGWVPLVAILGYLIWQNRRRAQMIVETEYTLLQIQAPAASDKSELAAEQMFASLHSILRPKAELVREGRLQEHLSFEIVAVDNQIRFYVW